MAHSNHLSDPWKDADMGPTHAETPSPDGADGDELWSAAQSGFETAPIHQRLDIESFDDIYIVGDVHGCIDELRELLNRLDVGTADLVAFVGDLVRKGPDSTAVLDLVQSQPNLVSVRGNNEQKFIDGNANSAQLGGRLDQISELPAALSFGEALVVHGGVDPRRPLTAQTRADLLETRSIPAENGYTGPFWFERHEGPPRVFFGHTVLRAPVKREWAVGLDTGCVYGGQLTAYDYRRDGFVSVQAEKTYRSRDSAKFVDPARI
jgi:serine/threonine protein phosphatase 1